MFSSLEEPAQNQSALQCFSMHVFDSHVCHPTRPRAGTTRRAVHYSRCRLRPSNPVARDHLTGKTGRIVPASFCPDLTHNPCQQDCRWCPNVALYLRTIDLYLIFLQPSERISPSIQLSGRLAGQLLRIEQLVLWLGPMEAHQTEVRRMSCSHCPWSAIDRVTWFWMRDNQSYRFCSQYRFVHAVQLVHVGLGSVRAMRYRVIKCRLCQKQLPVLYTCLSVYQTTSCHHEVFEPKITEVDDCQSKQCSNSGALLPLLSIMAGHKGRL
jgi:hypothetical protein